MNIKNYSHYLVFLFLFLFISNIRSNSKDSLLFPNLIFDPTESQLYISFNKLSNNTLLDYSVYAPFAFGFNKIIKNYSKSQIVWNCVAHTQFGIRDENNQYNKGIRRSMLNVDYQIGFSFVTKINQNTSIRFKLHHQSSHLGDDHLLIDKSMLISNPKGYWATDPSNFENSSITISKYLNPFTLYASIGTVLNPIHLRKPLSFQGGLMLKNISNSRLKNIITGFDIRILQHNNYNPGIKTGIGYKCHKSEPIYFMLEYYHGNLPYSRYESILCVNWFGIGLYIESLF